MTTRGLGKVGTIEIVNIGYRTNTNTSYLSNFVIGKLQVKKFDYALVFSRSV